MKIDDLKIRIEELISLADTVIASKKPSSHGASVSTESFSVLRSASLSFLRSAFGLEHPFYVDFDSKTKLGYAYEAEQGRGILKAAKQEIDGGWIFSLKDLISAEIFSDFIEMAEYLLTENYKDPAAVIIGSVLEEHLRHLCRKNIISLEITRNGKPVLKKTDLLNSELASAGIYGKLDQKSVTSWLDLRNLAAHGKYSDYSKDQVEIMYQGVTNFLTRVS